MLLWAGLVLLRIGWAVLPQTGYIHPDEFFQTVEVVAGDVMDINVERTWEFNQSSPIRSILIPSLLFHPPFRLLSTTSDNIQDFKISGRLVICASRLVMTLLSLCVDLCVYCICADLKLQGKTALLFLASSYVTLTYLTHSFSNSIETFILSAVIMLIVKSAHRGMAPIKGKNDNKEINDPNHKNHRGDSNGSDSETDVLSDSYGMLAKLHSSAFDLHRRKQKQSKEVTSEVHDKTVQNPNISQPPDVNIECQLTDNYPVLTCACLAVLNTAGIFNRPTFVLFSFLPFLWWISHIWRSISLLISRMTVFIVTSFVTTVLFCVVDTVYYNDLALTDLIDLDRGVANIVFTPWNFIVYNTNVNNLAQHGRHPFYLHLLVNMPLLFGPLMFYIYKGVFKAFKNLSFVFTWKSKECLSSGRSSMPFSTIVLGVIFVPILVLSVFPHQEPRFLIPLIPLVVLYTVLTNEAFTNWFNIIFLIFNIVLSIMYGILHQGGLVPCLIKLHELTQREQAESSVSIIFSHTYMPPKHSLLMKNNSNVEIYDLKGSPFKEIHNTIFKLKISGLHQEESDSNRIFIVMPGTIVPHFREKYSGKVKLKTTEKFFPHLSLEDPPSISPGDTWATMKNKLSLFLLQIESS